MTSRAITVVLADNHGIVRESIAALCASHGIRVVGECADGATAVRAIVGLRPDVAILDSDLPGLPSVEVIRTLRAANVKSKLMILAISREEGTVQQALSAGADAYLLKDGPSHHLLDAITFVIKGGVFLSPSLHRAGRLRKQKAAIEDPMDSLSQREREVFSYLVNGLRAKEIAKLLGISPKTVDTYRAGLLRKLNVRDLPALVKFAIGRNRN